MAEEDNGGGFPEDVSHLSAAELTELSVDVCEDGDVEYLRGLVAQPAFDINAADSNGFQPLMYSVTFDQLGCFQVLLEAKADVTLSAGDGSTCLHVAAQNDLAHFVAPLVHAKADPDQQLSTGARPLDYALTATCPAAVQALVAVKCEVNYVKPAESAEGTNWAGQTPLRMAAGARHLGMFKTLLAAGADPIPPPPGHDDAATTLPPPPPTTTLVQDLLHRRQTDFLNAIAEAHARALPGGCVWDRLEVSGAPAFFSALYHSDPALLEYFVDAGADLSAADSSGSTALFVAATEGNLSAMRVILDHRGGLDPSSPSSTDGELQYQSHGNHTLPDGFTVAHLAVGGDNPDVLRVVCEYSATAIATAVANFTDDDLDVVPPSVDLDLRTADRHAAPLHFAAQRPDPRFCETLIDAGATVDLTLDGGFTALHLACQDGLVDTVDVRMDTEHGVLAATTL
jgi:ankyrin repeat protein